MKYPSYEKLYEKIRQDILSGSYIYGDKLPGKRILAEQNNVSVITVAHALEMLEDEGYISVRERSGCYISYRQVDDLHPLSSLSPVPVFEFTPPQKLEHPSSADVDGFPFSVLVRSMRRVLSEQREEILVKSPNSGLLNFRKSLSRYLSRTRGISARPEQIIIGAGAEYLYSLIVEMLGPKRVWAIEFPSYEKIEQVYSARGISLERLPLAHDGIRSNALQSCSASVLHLSPYRSYPSNVTASASKRMEYLRWADTDDRYIVEDDYESEFCLRQKPMEPLFAQSRKDNIVYLNTFSRTVSPAIRVGYMVLPLRLISLFEERVGFYSCTVPAFEQYVLSDLIDTGEFERHLHRVRRKLRAQLQDKLPSK